MEKREKRARENLFFYARLKTSRSTPFVLFFLGALTNSKAAPNWGTWTLRQLPKYRRYDVYAPLIDPRRGGSVPEARGSGPGGSASVRRRRAAAHAPPTPSLLANAAATRPLHLRRGLAGLRIDLYFARSREAH